MKLKTFESDRVQLLYEENLKTLKATQIEIEKLQKKNDVWLFMKIIFAIHLFVDLVNSKRIFQSASSIGPPFDGDRYRTE